MVRSKNAGIIGLLAVGAAATVIGLGCGGKGGWNPFIKPANFVAGVDNPRFPLTPGTLFVYEADTEDGVERIEVRVTHDTKVILGVTCTVVRDTVTLDGELVEDTFDWYAQDNVGNVWYFGEDSKEYQDGEVVSTAGSWEAGVNGAKPGIIMEANPRVGDTYYQEYAAGEAEDQGQVLGLHESVTVPCGSFADCLKTKDFTHLEPDIVEYKFYAPGVGLVLTLEDDVRVELIDVTGE